MEVQRLSVALEGAKKKLASRKEALNNANTGYTKVIKTAEVSRLLSTQLTYNAC